jgi:hypothetical protein
MLNQIKIYKTSKNLLWFQAASCSKVLGIRSNNFLRQVPTKKLGNQNHRHISEQTFLEVFKENPLMISQLKHYKNTGEIPLNNVYKDIWGMMSCYLGRIQSSEEVDLPGLKPMNPKDYLKQLYYGEEFEPLVESLIIFYTRVLFAEPINRSPIINTLMCYEAYKVKQVYPLCFSYDKQTCSNIVQNAGINFSFKKGMIENRPDKSYLFKETVSNLLVIDYILKGKNPLTKNYFEYPILSEQYINNALDCLTNPDLL